MKCELKHRRTAHCVLLRHIAAWEREHASPNHPRCNRPEKISSEAATGACARFRAAADSWGPPRSCCRPWALFAEERTALGQLQSTAWCASAAFPFLFSFFYVYFKSLSVTPKTARERLAAFPCSVPFTGQQSAQKRC